MAVPTPRSTLAANHQANLPFTPVNSPSACTLFVEMRTKLLTTPVRFYGRLPEVGKRFEAFANLAQNRQEFYGCRACGAIRPHDGANHPLNNRSFEPAPD